MTPPDSEDDDTIRVQRTVVASRRTAPPWMLPVAAIGGLCLLAAAGVSLWWPRPAPHAVPAVPPAPALVAPAAPPAAAPAPPPAAPEFAVQTASQAQILAHVGTGLAIFRFAPDPRIVVMDFGSLLTQGRMLDRVAALNEKAGLPHDRVLTSPQLDAAIRAGGDTVATYYYGHDYSAQELVRFFALADAEHVALHPQEETLRRIMQQLGWFQPGVHAALISIPQAGTDPRLTMAARSAILQHELSHGLYFSDPAYAAYVHRFWDSALTAEERAAFRRFLGSQEYDTSLDDLMINEMQAYLMFTRDPDFFRPALIGMAPVRLAELQAAFARGMPAGWLRDTLLALDTEVTQASAPIR
ncbi:MAG TPA: hypothetical protein VFN42_10825 [Acetobacteraceae bacterium]|nr:hypothetical protein [Acetobacteraceae bacterium]